MEIQPVAIVTGANGFLAKNLILCLHSKGWRVIKISREANHIGCRDTLSWESFWRGDSCDLTSVATLFHLAAYRPPNLEDANFAGKCLEINAMLTLRLAEMMAKKSSGRFIYCSAGNIYGQREEQATETAPIQLATRACFYLSSKFLGEVFLERTRFALGLRTTTFRVSSLYGPGMPTGNLVALFASLAREGLPLPLRQGGLEYYDMVFVDDVVDLLIRAATSSADGIFNAGSGKSVSVKEVAETVNEVFGNSAGWKVDESYATHSQPGFAPLSLNSSSETFDYAPRSLRAGIAQYRNWLETHSL